MSNEPTNIEKWELSKTKQFLHDECDPSRGIISLADEIDADTLYLFTLRMYAMKPDQSLLILLNSPGGNVQAGMGIYDLIKAHKGTTTIRVIGEACSMACVILQAGDIRQAMPNSVLMHHVGTFGMEGHAKNMKHYAAFYKKQSERIDSIMLQRVNERIAKSIEATKLIKLTDTAGAESLEEEKLKTKAWWTERDLWDNWMFPEDAIAIGLLDSIYNG